MRWHSLLPDRLGAWLAILQDRWRRRRYGEPPECEVCGGRAHFAQSGSSDPAYYCVMHHNRATLGVRDIEPARDWE